MGTLISLNIELNSIRSFLSTVLAAADSEYLRIKEKSDADDFEHYEDEGNALYKPMMWEEIAFRATLGELNAIVEWELQNLATKPFFENSKESKKKQVKTVSDLKINEIIKLIEKYYQIEINEIESYIVVIGIRKKVNSFKHRKGFKNPWKDIYDVIPEKFEVSRKDAFKNINCVRNFLKDLWSKTKYNQKG